MFKIYSTHKTYSCLITSEALAAEEGKAFAESAAKLGHTRLVRVFEVSGVTGESFVTSWSVIGGEVTEHPSPTIPAAHW